MDRGTTSQGEVVLEVVHRVATLVVSEVGALVAEVPEAPGKIHTYCIFNRMTFHLPGHPILVCYKLFAEPMKSLEVNQEAISLCPYLV